MADTKGGTMVAIFDQSQRGVQGHEKLVNNLMTIYNTTDSDGFWNEFRRLITYSLVVYRREPSVERTIQFIAKFAASLAAPTEGTEESCSDGETSAMPPVLLKLFRFLLKHHNAKDRAVRFRTCQLLNRLLACMADSAAVDDDLYDDVHDCMLERMRDRCPAIRVQAVFAVARLQDPTDANCPAIKAYLFLLGCDASADVRRAVLMNIALAAHTLPAVVARTRDANASVRRTAYETIAQKVHMRVLTIAQRVALLTDGLNDSVAAVREACSLRVLQAWLRSCQGNILDLLSALDVEGSESVARDALRSLFVKSPCEDLVLNIDLLNERLVIPLDKLTVDSALYWCCLCEHIASLGTEAEEHLEKILPSASVFSEYLRSIHDKLSNASSVDDQMSSEFILRQLLTLASCLDLSEEVGRHEFEKLLQQLLPDPRLPPSLVCPLAAAQRRLYVTSAPTQRADSLAAIIADVRQPMVATECPLGAEEKRKVELKLAHVRVQLNELRDEMEQCAAREEFARAEQVKGRIAQLDASKLELQSELQPKVVDVQQNMQDDPKTLLKCLAIAAETLLDPQLKSLTPSLQTLVDTLILPSIQNEHSAVRLAAVKALGLCCLLNKDMARRFLLLFMQVSQFDETPIQVVALQAVFDLLHTLGFETFQLTEDVPEEQNDEDAKKDGDEEEDEEEDDRQKKDKYNTVTGIISFLITLLDSKSSDLRTVAAEGLAKLLLAGRVNSPQLLCRLLLLWYNPLTEDDVHLRHCLGTFFPLYAFASLSHQEVLEEAFLPTLRTLFQAPATSPLSVVDTANVAELLVQLTNENRLLDANGTTPDGTRPPQESCVHDSIAVKISNEIISKPAAPDVKLLCRILNMLELSRPGNSSRLRELKVLTTTMMKEVEDTACHPLLKKFYRTVKDLLLVAATPGRTAISTNDESDKSDEAEDKDKEMETAGESRAESVTEVNAPDETADASRNEPAQDVSAIPAPQSKPQTAGPAKKSQTKKPSTKTSQQQQRRRRTTVDSKSDDDDDYEQQVDDKSMDSVDEEDKKTSAPPPPRRKSTRQAKQSAMAATRKNLAEELDEELDTDSD